MSEASDVALNKKVIILRQRILEYDNLEKLSKLAGMVYENSKDGEYLKFPFFNENVILVYPEIVAYSHNMVNQLNIFTQAAICYHLYTVISKESEIFSGEWISFFDLENGRFYNKAFQGYSGDLLAKQAEKIMDLSNVIIQGLCAQKIDLGDLGFSIQVFPRVPLAMAIWIGDEDFPSSCRILFDRSINSYLPTDACAILGSMFTQRILKFVR